LSLELYSAFIKSINSNNFLISKSEVPILSFSFKAFSNLSSSDSSTLTIVVRYIGKLPISLTMKLKDINLSYMLISNTNEMKN
jgi:hypothetical protein